MVYACNRRCFSASKVVVMYLTAALVTQSLVKWTLARIHARLCGKMGAKESKGGTRWCGSNIGP